MIELLALGVAIDVGILFATLTTFILGINEVKENDNWKPMSAAAIMILIVIAVWVLLAGVAHSCGVEHMALAIKEVQ